jgi:hypothetical protein
MYFPGDSANPDSMPSTESSGLKRWAHLFFVGLCFSTIPLVYWVNHGLQTVQASNPNPNLPFGVFQLPGGGIFTQDFSYNMLYFKGIEEHLVSRPYQLSDQEKMMRQLLPQSASGLSHAYSPVAYVMALPLLSVTGAQSYLIYTTVSAAGILCLYYFCLLPRIRSPGQLCALAICAFSMCVAITFTLGQSSLVTTSLLGVFWFLLQRRSKDSGINLDLGIALLFWALCLKPSVAIIPFALLLGAQAWRVAVLSLIFLLVTWTLVAGHYGGWWTGLQDYQSLLNHYNNADFPPFMQRGQETTLEKAQTLHWFALNRGIVLISFPLLILLRWSRRITASQLFQAVVGIFLLFSPYLLPSEDWILCLLVVEGSFFRSGNFVALLVKLLLLASIMDLRFNLPYPDQTHFVFKCFLFLWIFIEECRGAHNSTDGLASQPT